MTTLTLTLLKTLFAAVGSALSSIGGAGSLGFTFATRRSSRSTAQSTGNRYGPLFFIALIVGVLSSLGFLGILVTALMVS